MIHMQRGKNNMGKIIEISKKKIPPEKVLMVVLDGKHEWMVLANQKTLCDVILQLTLLDWVQQEKAK